MYILEKKVNDFYVVVYEGYDLDSAICYLRAFRDKYPLEKYRLVELLLNV